MLKKTSFLRILNILNSWLAENMVTYFSVTKIPNLLKKKKKKKKASYVCKKVDKFIPDLFKKTVILP